MLHNCRDLCRYHWYQLQHQTVIPATRHSSVYTMAVESEEPPKRLTPEDLLKRINCGSPVRNVLVACLTVRLILHLLASQRRPH